MRESRSRIPRTEERIFPPVRRPEDGMLAEHWARYRFVADRLAGVVLDLGSGTGYGCSEVARSARVRAVVGCDRSPQALGLASRYYPDAKVEYREADLEREGWVAALPEADAILAFEIIEHLKDEGAFWAGIGRLLRPRGTLWLSTPLGRGRGRPVSDPHHVHQLRRGEVLALFREGWRVGVYGQSGTWIEPWIAGRRYYTIVVCARRGAGPGKEWKH